jgi:hypothetical protein
MNSTFLALCLNELYFPTTVPSCAHAHWSVIGASGVYGACVAYILYMLILTVYRLAGGGLSHGRCAQPPQTPPPPSLTPLPFH